MSDPAKNCTTKLYFWVLSKWLIFYLRLIHTSADSAVDWLCWCRDRNFYISAALCNRPICGICTSVNEPLHRVSHIYSGIRMALGYNSFYCFWSFILYFFFSELFHRRLAVNIELGNRCIFRGKNHRKKLNISILLIPHWRTISRPFQNLQWGHAAKFPGYKSIDVG